MMLRRVKPNLAWMICLMSRMLCPKAVDRKFWNDKGHDSRYTKSPLGNPQEFTIQKSVFQHPRFNHRRIATMMLLYLALSLLSWPLCSASECLEAVQGVCHEVIEENNDLLLETVEEMVSNRSCNALNVSNQIRDIEETLGNTIEQHFEQLYQKIANSTQGKS